MKNLTSLIKENNETKKYKYKATVIVEGTVTAMTEGDAGELADKEIDKIANVTDFKIDEIDEIETGVKENFIEDSDDEEIANAAYNEIIAMYEKSVTDMKDYYVAMVTTRLRMYFDEK